MPAVGSRVEFFDGGEQVDAVRATDDVDAAVTDGDSERAARHRHGRQQCPLICQRIEALQRAQPRRAAEATHGVQVRAHRSQAAVRPSSAKPWVYYVQQCGVFRLFDSLLRFLSRYKVKKLFAIGSCGDGVL